VQRVFTFFDRAHFKPPLRESPVKNVLPQIRETYSPLIDFQSPSRQDFFLLSFFLSFANFARAVCKPFSRDRPSWCLSDFFPNGFLPVLHCLSPPPHYSSDRRLLAQIVTFFDMPSASHSGGGIKEVFPVADHDIWTPPIIFSRDRFHSRHPSMRIVFVGFWFSPSVPANYVPGSSSWLHPPDNLTPVIAWIFTCHSDTKTSSGGVIEAVTRVLRGLGALPSFPR